MGGFSTATGLIASPAAGVISQNYSIHGILIVALGLASSMIMFEAWPC